MSRRCTICTSAQRAEIDLMLNGGKSDAEIARLAHVSEDSIGRHRTHKHHLRKGGDAAPSGALTELAGEIDELISVLQQSGDNRGLVQALALKVRMADVAVRAPQQALGTDWVKVGSVAWLDSLVRFGEDVQARRPFFWTEEIQDGNTTGAVLETEETDAPN